MHLQITTSSFINGSMLIPIQDPKKNYPLL
jgi:hypothetical protein